MPCWFIFDNIHSRPGLNTTIIQGFPLKLTFPLLLLSWANPSDPNRLQLCIFPLRLELRQRSAAHTGFRLHSNWWHHLLFPAGTVTVCLVKTARTQEESQKLLAFSFLGYLVRLDPDFLQVFLTWDLICLVNNRKPVVLVSFTSYLYLALMWASLCTGPLIPFREHLH